jgi:glycosidase
MDFWKNLTIYHIFIDRFAGFDSGADDTRPNWTGGNIKGIIKKITYLKNLGITAVWLSPFYKGSSYHGYHVTDFYEVDDHFGGKNDLKSLVNICHQSNIRVIMDCVPNHCSSQHPFFVQTQKNKNSKYKNWFTFTKWPHDYLCFLTVKDLPKLNLKNRETRDYIIQNTLYWLKEFDFDGLRLDHAIGPSHDFWKEFREKIKGGVKKEIVLVGEVWREGDELSSEGIGDISMLSYVNILDGCLDFTFNKLIKDFILEEKISKSVFQEKLKNHYERFPKNFLLPTFLDNHDMNRFLFEANGDKEKLKKAMEIQFSIKQPKIIYYGTEVGLSQSRSIKDFKKYGDLQARKKMIWNKNKQDASLLSLYRNYITK